ncbi:MAG: hypothetical protein PHW15_02545 [Patescibacteria group bacterium]|nr:hypothetical protein [Patescibacteria group bacterium]MDD5172768.1 hypothetical protein [Patescibacteria group bacterium]
MKTINIRSLFKENLNFIWANPILWVWGFFAAPLLNNEIILLTKNYKKIIDWINQSIAFKLINSSLGGIFESLSFLNFLNSNISFIILIVLITVLLFFLSFLSQIALILSVKNRQNLLFKKTWKQGKSFIWPVIGVYLLVFIITYGFLFLLSIPLLFNHLLIIIPVVIFLLLGVILSFISRYVLFFIILENNRFLKSIKNGFSFFIKNWGTTIKTSFCIFLIMFLIGLIILLISIGAAIPFVIIIDLVLKLNLMFLFWLISIIFILLIIVFVLFLSSTFSAWQTAVWSSLFLKLSNKPSLSLNKE